MTMIKTYLLGELLREVANKFLVCILWTTYLFHGVTLFLKKWDLSSGFQVEVLVQREIQNPNLIYTRILV